MVSSLIHNQKLKNSSFIETQKSSLRDLARFHSGLFELEIIQMCITAFLFKTITWTWIFFEYCRALSLKTKKNLKKDASHLKIAWDSKGKNKNIEKWERNRKMKKSQTATIIFFYFYFLCRKNYVLSENIFGKI